MIRLLQDQAKALVEAIATSTSSVERVQLLTVAVPIFGDLLPTLRGGELSLAIPVLVHLFRRAVRQMEWSEVPGLASTLMCLLRGAAFEAVLTQHYRHLVTASLSAMIQGPDVIASPVVQLLQNVAQCPVSIRNAHQEVNDVVAVLQRILVSDNTTVRPFVICTAIKLLVGLAQSMDNKVYLMQRPGLVQAVVAVPLNGSTHHLDEPVACLWKHLAWETRNRAAMMDTQGLLPSLVLLNDKGDMPTRLHVMTTLRRLSMSAGNNNAKLVQVTGMMNAITMAMQHEELQLEAVSTLLCLISPDTTLRMLSSELVACLMAAMPVETNSCVKSQQVSVIAAHCIKKLAANIQVSDEHYQELLNAIMTMAHAANAGVRKWAASSILAMASKLCIGFVLVRDTAVMTTINRLANDHEASVKTPATEALMHLLSNAANLKRIMAYDDIVNTMIDNSKHWCEQTSRQAIECILTLVDYLPLRPRVAKQLDLVACLSEFGVHKDSDPLLKQAALQGVIVLAPLL